MLQLRHQMLKAQREERDPNFWREEGRIKKAVTEEMASPPRLLGGEWVENYLG